MRKEPFGVGSFVHVVKRGARGAPIVRDDGDRMRFVRLLFLLNDSHLPTNRHVSEVHKSDLCYRPDDWPSREPLVGILAWTLMPNHFHLLLRELTKGGVSRFMQRLGGSMSVAFNQKYDETGSLFQGAYKSRTVDDDAYLRYVFSYITAKNVLELFPGGLAAAVGDFDSAWQWALSYKFSSMRDHALVSRSSILDDVALHDLGLPGPNFKEDAWNMISAHADTREEFAPVLLENW